MSKNLRPGHKQMTMRAYMRGVTLMELMVVVVIVGILAAIAIPQFASYRAKAYNSASNADLKNIKTGMEAYMADNQEYPADVQNL